MRELDKLRDKIYLVKEVLTSDFLLFCLNIDYEWILKEVRKDFPRAPEKSILKEVHESVWINTEKILRRYNVKQVHICKNVEPIFKNRIMYKIEELSGLADVLAWANLRRPREVKMNKVKEIRLRERLKVFVKSRLREKDNSGNTSALAQPHTRQRFAATLCGL